MKALISPIENVQYISGWNPPIAPSKLYTPVYTVCGERIVQVQETTFPVAEPYFWIDCADTISPATNCYDGTLSIIITIPPNATDPNPPIPEPISTGTKPA